MASTYDIKDGDRNYINRTFDVENKKNTRVHLCLLFTKEAIENKNKDVFPGKEDQKGQEMAFKYLTDSYLRKALDLHVEFKN